MPEPRMERIDTVRRTAACLAVLAAIFAAWAGWTWHSAAHDGGYAYSRARDAVLQSAEQGVQNLNTLDYRDVDAGLATWLDSTSGDLHQQIAQGRSGFVAQVRKARTVTTAKILDAAVSELDERSGKASVLVAVETTVTPPDGAPVTKQNRLAGRLARTGGGWKLTGLGQAPTGTT